MDETEAVSLLNKYAEEGRGETFARRAIIGRDRSVEGRLVQIVFFDSAHEAEANNELAVTQAQWRRVQRSCFGSEVR